MQFKSIVVFLFIKFNLNIKNILSAEWFKDTLHYNIGKIMAKRENY